MSDPWREIGDRVFVRRYEFFDQTIGAVIGQAGVVVIDTRSLLSQADELRADLRALTDAPLAAVVNTHHHYDHTFGNLRFVPAPIWGHRRCAEILRDEGEAHRERVMAEMPMLADEVREIEVVPPTVTFEDETTLDLGDRQLALRHLGRGHTDNDAIVIVRAAADGHDVVFAGDLFENGAPPSFGDAYPVAWAATATRLLALIDGPVSPGHGEPADRAFAERQAGELAEVARLCTASLAGEISADEVLRRSPYPAVTTRHALRRARAEAAERA
jgi:glyoxylase-like metal-dependent hydrolase (beta-lactamase superfamily II)